ncbi:MAG TPA: transporter substrate-binding domain-containing protein [Spirochaetales bacterium]|nr:transporter substrate-binding domain-containing protein [Spirochaetales bacterium]
MTARRPFGIALFTCAFVLAIGAQARIPVTVAATASAQIPFTFADGTGLGQDLVDALNAHQSNYEFTYVLMPTLRVTEMVGSGLIDLASLHNIAWGWDSDKAVATMDLFVARDVFIARKEALRGESFFDGIGTLPMVGVIGFHYRFAGYSEDQAALRRDFNLVLVKDELTVIRMILEGRGDIGIVASTTLDYLRKVDPALHARLLVSERYDSEYSRHYVVSPVSPLKAAELDGYLRILARNGSLSAIFERYGLKALPIP